MRNRSKVQKGRSRKLFRKTAGRTHRANLTPRPLRGGGRL